MLGLGGCLQALSSCGRRGLLSSCRAQVSYCSRFLLQSMGSGTQDSVVEGHGFSSCHLHCLELSPVVVVHYLGRFGCPVAYGIFPDQGSNLCPCVRFLTTEPPRKSQDSVLLTSVQPKLICRFSAIPVKVPAGFFVETDNLILKFSKKNQRTQTGLNNLEKNKI